MLTQKAKAQITVKTASGSASWVCQYHTPAGLKCAIGCLIPDDKYNLRMEGRGIVKNEQTLDDIDLAIRAATGIDDNNAGLASALQWIHDNEPIEIWESKLDRIAEDYRLEVKNV